jgi:hypothetical protein
MMAALILQLTWTYSRLRIAARVGRLALLYPLCICNSRAESSLCLIVGSCAGMRVKSALNDKAFFIAARARDA